MSAEEELIGKIKISVEGIPELEDLKKKTDDVKAPTQRAISGYNTASRVLGNLGSIITSVSIMSFVYNLIQRKLETSTVAVADASRRYEQNLRRYGASSERTTAALQKLRMAQEGLVRAQRESTLNWVILIVQGGLLAAQVVKNVVALGNYIRSTQLATAADLLHIKVLGVKIGMLAAVTLGIGAVIAALSMYWAQAKTAEIIGGIPGAGVGGVGGLSISHRAEFTIRGEEDIDRAYQQMSEEAKTELRRSGG